MEDILKHIIEAQKYAINKGIDANLVIIDKEIAEVNSFYVGNDFKFPKSVAGMRVAYDKLPQDVSFLVTKSESETSSPSYEDLLAENKELKKKVEKLESIKKIVEDEQ